MTGTDRALAELLAGRTKPDLYQWRGSASSAAVQGWRDQATRAGWRTFWLDGSLVGDKDTFLRRCAETFDFPEWFGENWDALEDDLTDLSWAPARNGYLVLWERWNRLAEEDQPTFRTAIDVFLEAVEFWRDSGTPMAVLMLPTPGVEIAGIPRLTAPDPGEESEEGDQGPGRQAQRSERQDPAPEWRDQGPENREGPEGPERGDRRPGGRRDDEPGGQ